MMMDDFLHKPQLALPSRLMDSRHFTWQRSKTSVSRLKVDIELQVYIVDKQKINETFVSRW